MLAVGCDINVYVLALRRTVPFFYIHLFPYSSNPSSQIFINENGSGRCVGYLVSFKFDVFDSEVLRETHLSES
jgi:hypothetical protein